MFSLSQLARHLGLSAEDCLHQCSARFISRFNQMEENVAKPLAQMSAEELDVEWRKAKEFLLR